MNIVEHARLFAIAAHGAINQRRKYTDEPYIVHPIAVAKIVREYDHDENMVAAALLHDVVEDTAIDIKTIRQAFNSDVADLVADLTDVSKPEDGNRRTRKAIDRAHTAQASLRAQVIKCADLIHNTDSIVNADPNFARVYMREKMMLLEAMTKVHGTEIHARAERLVEDYYRTRREEER